MRKLLTAVALLAMNSAFAESYVTLQYDHLGKPPVCSQMDCPAAVKQYFQQGGTLKATIDMTHAPQKPGQNGYAILQSQLGSAIHLNHSVDLWNEGLTNELGFISDDPDIEMKVGTHAEKADRINLLGNWGQFKSGILIGNCCLIQGHSQ